MRYSIRSDSYDDLLSPTYRWFAQIALGASGQPSDDAARLRRAPDPTKAEQGESQVALFITQNPKVALFITQKKNPGKFATWGSALLGPGRVWMAPVRFLHV